MMRRLAYLALAVLSMSFAPYGLAQDAADVFRSQLAVNNEAESNFNSQLPLHSVELNYADAHSVEQTITKLFSGINVVSESQTNTIYFRANDKAANDVQDFAALIDARARDQQEEDERQQTRIRRRYETKDNEKAVEDLPHVDHAFKLPKTQDEKFLLKMLTMLVEPRGGKFLWDADERHLIGTYPADLDEVVSRVISTFHNRQAAPSIDWQSQLPDFLNALRHTAVELEELRTKLGSRHPKVHQLERKLESILKWTGADLAAQYESLSGRPNPPSFSQNAEEFHQHEETASALATEFRNLPLTDDSPESDAKVAELLDQLKAAVNDAFTARQEMQKAEASALRQQLERIEARIERRADIRERIVARRVAELLQTPPEDAWDPAPQSGPYSRQSIDEEVEDQRADADDFDHGFDPFPGRPETPEPESQPVPQENKAEDTVPAPVDSDFDEA